MADQRGAPISWLWYGLLALWFVVLWVGPDPRPLGAPEWAVDLASLLGLSEAAARAAASLVLRVGGLALLGALLMLAVGAKKLGRAAVVAILLAPVLAVAALWANYGYFPTRLIRPGQLSRRQAWRRQTNRPVTSAPAGALIPGLFQDLLD